MLIYLVPWVSFFRKRFYINNCNIQNKKSFANFNWLNTIRLENSLKLSAHYPCYALKNINWHIYFLMTPYPPAISFRVVWNAEFSHTSSSNAEKFLKHISILIKNQFFFICVIKVSFSFIKYQKSFMIVALYYIRSVSNDKINDY